MTATIGVVAATTPACTADAVPGPRFGDDLGAVAPRDAGGVIGAVVVDHQRPVAGGMAASTAGSDSSSLRQGSTTVTRSCGMPSDPRTRSEPADDGGCGVSGCCGAPAAASACWGGSSAASCVAVRRRRRLGRVGAGRRLGRVVTASCECRRRRGAWSAACVVCGVVVGRCRRWRRRSRRRRRRWWSVGVVGVVGVVGGVVRRSYGVGCGRQPGNGMMIGTGIGTFGFGHRTRYAGHGTGERGNRRGPPTPGDVPAAECRPLASGMTPPWNPALG